MFIIVMRILITRYLGLYIVPPLNVIKPQGHNMATRDKLDHITFDDYGSFLDHMDQTYGSSLSDYCIQEVSAPLV